MREGRGLRQEGRGKGEARKRRGREGGRTEAREIGGASALFFLPSHSMQPLALDTPESSLQCPSRWHAASGLRRTWMGCEWTGDVEEQAFDISQLRSE